MQEFKVVSIKGTEITVSRSGDGTEYAFALLDDHGLALTAARKGAEPLASALTHSEATHRAQMFAERELRNSLRGHAT